MDRFCVILDSDPYGSEAASEALRTGLGLTISGSKVAVVFLGRAVHLLRPGDGDAMDRPALGQHLVTLVEMGGRLLAEEEALQAAGLDGEFAAEVETVTWSSISQVIAESSAVVRF